MNKIKNKIHLPLLHCFYSIILIFKSGFFSFFHYYYHYYFYDEKKNFFGCLLHYKRQGEVNFY